MQRIPALCEGNERFIIFDFMPVKYYDVYVLVEDTLSNDIHCVEDTLIGVF